MIRPAIVAISLLMWMRKCVENKVVKVGTKLTPSEHRLLLKTVHDYGFSSMYQLIQTLIRCFLRSVNSQYDATFDDAMSVDIEQMFQGLIDEGSDKEGKLKIYRHKR
jgi:hypothetical protein